MVRGRVVLPKVDQLPPAEEDLQKLLHRFSEAVARGEPLSFATFKRLWKEMSISFIFEVPALQHLYSVHTSLTGTFRVVGYCCRLFPQSYVMRRWDRAERHKQPGLLWPRALLLDNSILLDFTDLRIGSMQVKICAYNRWCRSIQPIDSHIHSNFQGMSNEALNSVLYYAVLPREIYTRYSPKNGLLLSLY